MRDGIVESASGRAAKVEIESLAGVAAACSRIRGQVD